jgi:hypothetical protein
MPGSIDSILDELDQVLAESRQHRSRLGYFAALYRDVTARVKAAIEAGEFENGPRMERLDVQFARRYLDALDARDADEDPPRAWARTFAAAQRWRPLILQHLLLGMNAHINLDLGIAAVEVATEASLADLKPDFDHINQILASMIESVQDRVATVSPWIGVLDRIGGHADEAISNFRLIHARRDAWSFAQTLAPFSSAERATAIAAKDQETAARTGPILRPGSPWARPVLLWIRVWETTSVPTVLSTLSRTSPAV